MIDIHSDSRRRLLEEFRGVASEYDTRWSFYVEATTRETLARLGPHPSGRLLDVGCGTGALLGALARAYPRAVLSGIDPVPDMLSIARKRLPASVDLRDGWAEEIPCPSDCFDAVLSSNVFHYIRQPETALKEMSRALRPGGQLVITDWCDDYLAWRICDLYLRMFNQAHFKVYRQRELLRLLQEAGYENVLVERYKINWLWGLMTAVAFKPSS